MCCGGSSGSQTSTQTYQLPKWIENAGQQTYNRANTVSKTPYTPYEGPRVADFTPDQTAAFDAVKGNAGAWQPYLDNAGQLISDKAQQSFPGADLSGYMSPYVHDVVGSQIKDIQRGTDQRVAQLGRDAALGSFGGSRQGVAQGQLYQGEQRAIEDAAARGYQGAFDRAANLYTTDQARQLQAAGMLPGLGQTASQLGYSDAAALRDIGGQQQQNAQQNLDVGYQDFLRQQQYPLDMTNFVSSVLRGTPYSSTTYTQQPYNQTAQNIGAFSSLAGLGLLGYSAYGG